MIYNAFFVDQKSPSEFFILITADALSEHLNLLFIYQGEFSEFISLKHDFETLICSYHFTQWVFLNAIGRPAN